MRVPIDPNGVAFAMKAPINKIAKKPKIITLTNAMVMNVIFIPLINLFTPPLLNIYA